MDYFDYIYGKRNVEEFIAKHPKLIKKIFVKKDFKFNNDIDISKFIIEHLSSKDFDEEFKNQINNQGIVCEVKEYNYAPFKEILLELEKTNDGLILILDKIHDPYNFGSIIRTASLVGVDAIIIMDHNQVFVTPTVTKVSSGTVYDLKISKVVNINQAIENLKKIGYWVYATNLNKEAIDMRHVNFSGKTAIVIGNEHDGVSPLVTKNSDMNIYIPSQKNIDSYNASVAASLILFEVANKIGKFNK